MKKTKLFFLIFLVCISITNVFADANLPNDIPKARAKVIDIIDEYEEGNMGFENIIQEVKVEITNGEFKGETIITKNYLMNNPVYDINLSKGDRVIVGLELENGSLKNVYVESFIRDIYLYILIIVFILLLITIGKMKGLKSVITLTLTLFLVLKVLIPGILRGYNPIILGILISLIVTITTLFIISGVNAKSIGAIIGVLGGLIASASIAFLVGNQINLTGLSQGEAQMVMYIPSEQDLNIQGLLFTGIIIGALGAIMDVGISISSAMKEIKLAKPDIHPKQLIESGLNVGKDIMGTMSNTLILAYTGGAINLLILFNSYDVPFNSIINSELIATEILRALSGSIGLILTVPITALATTLLLELYE